MVMATHGSALHSTLPPLFRMAAITGAADAIKSFLSRGSDPNLTDKMGRSPLILAATKGHVTICRLLLESGANITLRDAEGYDALASAIRNGQKDAEAALRSHIEQTDMAVPSDPVGSDAPSIDPDPAGSKTPEAAIHIVLSNNDPLNISVWEEEEEIQAPSADPSCLVDAEKIQERITAHVPIDMDEEWAGVDIELPDAFMPRLRVESVDKNWLAEIAWLIRSGIEEGFVTGRQLDASLPRDQSDEALPDSHYDNALRVVLGDVGVAIEPDPVLASRPREVTKDEVELDDDLKESIADDAISFFGNLTSSASDLLTQYRSVAQSQRRLSREEEQVLFIEIMDGNRMAMEGIARCPTALDELLHYAEKVDRGEAPLSSILRPQAAGSDNLEATENVDGQVAEDQGEKGEDADQGGNEAAVSRSPSDAIAKLEKIVGLCRKLRQQGVEQDSKRLVDSLVEELLAVPLTDKFTAQLREAVEGDTPKGIARDLMATGLKRAEKAKCELAGSHLALVIWLAGKYPRWLLPLMDRVQEGNLGLLKAMDRYDPHRGVKFSTYATWWIRQSISRGIADSALMIRLPVHVQEAIRKVNRASNAFLNQTGRSPTAGEIVNEVDLPLLSIENAMKVPEEPSRIDTVCIDEEILEEIGEDTAIPAPDHVYESRELRAVLEELLDTLSERQANVIRLRFGLYDGLDHTLEEIGQIYNVTRERIRQIEAKALKMLAHPARATKIATFIEQTPHS